MRARSANPIAFASDPTVSESDSMMAGSDIYRRIQSTPKRSPLPYIVSAVAVIAVGAGAVYYLQKSPAQSASPYIQSPAAQSLAPQPWTDASRQHANAAASHANSSAKFAMAARDPARIDATSDAAAKRPQPPSQRVHQASVELRRTAPSAESNGTDASVYTPAPVNSPAPSTPIQAPLTTTVHAPPPATSSSAQDAAPQVQPRSQGQAQAPQQPQDQSQTQAQP